MFVGMHYTAVAMNEFVEYRKNRDPRLRDRIVERHLALAYSIVRRFEGRGEEEEDLTQVALIALTRAVERFDPERGFAFSTFATPTISGALKRHLRDHTWIVRPPRSLGERVLCVAATVEELTTTLGRHPTTDELATEGGWTRAEVEEATHVLQTHRRCERESIGESKAGEVAAPECDVPAADDRVLVGELLASLEPRRRRIARMRYIDDLTQSAIAARVGMNQTQISRMLEQIRAELRTRPDPRDLARVG
jgi:RNA polymerase sigma-B factor